MLRRNPVRFHLIIALTLCVVGTVAAWWFLTPHRNQWPVWVAIWLPVINVVTFGYYGADKLLAVREMWRVPELALHTLSVLGGSVGAFLAMWVFRHKTIKSSFRILFWGIVILQLLLAGYIVKRVWWE